MGDGFVLEAVAGLYKKKKDMKKGVAFPTCISVNHCVCAYSPMDDDAVLAAGDLVKIDLGCHVDGYIGVVAGSTVVGASAEEPASCKAADVLAAAYIGAEAILRLVKPGAKVRSEQKNPAPALRHISADRLSCARRTRTSRRFWRRSRRPTAAPWWRACCRTR